MQPGKLLFKVGRKDILPQMLFYLVDGPETSCFEFIAVGSDLTVEDGDMGIYQLLFYGRFECVTKKPDGQRTR